MRNVKRKLTEAQRADVVMRLACYDLPCAIVKGLKEDFGVEISRQAIERYDPTRNNGRTCPERWAALFYETRRRLVEGIADIGAAHKMVRIRWLDQMARRKIADENTAEARALLKQVAEEMGEGVTHRHEHHGIVLHGSVSGVEIDARIAATAAKLGLAVVPLGALAAPGAEAVVAEPQPADEPVSG
jgi:hypothetical protein